MIFSSFLENIFFLLIVKFKILGEVNIQYSKKGGSSLDLFQFNSVFPITKNLYLSHTGGCENE